MDRRSGLLAKRGRALAEQRDSSARGQDPRRLNYIANASYLQSNDLGSREGPPEQLRLLRLVGATLIDDGGALVAEGLERAGELDLGGLLANLPPGLSVHRAVLVTRSTAAEGEL